MDAKQLRNQLTKKYIATRIFPKMLTLVGIFDEHMEIQEIVGEDGNLSNRLVRTYLPKSEREAIGFIKKYYRLRRTNLKIPRYGIVFELLGSK